MAFKQIRLAEYLAGYLQGKQHVSIDFLDDIDEVVSVLQRHSITKQPLLVMHDKQEEEEQTYVFALTIAHLLLQHLEDDGIILVPCSTESTQGLTLEGRDLEYHDEALHLLLNAVSHMRSTKEVSSLYRDARQTMEEILAGAPEITRAAVGKASWSSYYHQLRSA